LRKSIFKQTTLLSLYIKKLISIRDQFFDFM